MFLSITVAGVAICVTIAGRLAIGELGLLGPRPALHVRLDVEVGEESKHDYHVACQQSFTPEWKVTWD